MTAKVQPKNDLIKTDEEFTFNDFVERTTLHGLQDLYTATSKITIGVWSCVLVAFTAILCYSIYGCFREFYENPIQTAIQVVPLQEMQFPDIIICPSNFINYTKLKQMTLDDPEKAARIQSQKMSRNKQTNRGSHNIKATFLMNFARLQNVSVEEHSTESNQTSTVNHAEHEHSIWQQEEEILEASFDSHKFIRETELLTDFTSPGGMGFPEMIPIYRTRDLDHGVCYVVDMSNPRQVRPGMFLRVVVDLHTELDHNKDPNMLAIYDGIKVRLGNPSYHPISHGGTLIRPGNIAQLSLSTSIEQLVTVTQFTQNPQHCVSDHDDAKHSKLKVLNVPYSLEACLWDCEQQHIFKHICLMPVNLTFINPEEVEKHSWFCERPEYFDNVSNEKQYFDCRYNCWRPCETHKYHAVTSTQKFPSHKTMQLVSIDNSLVLNPPGSTTSELIPCPELTVIEAEFSYDTCNHDCLQKIAIDFMKCHLPTSHEFTKQVLNVTENMAICNQNIEVENLSADVSNILQQCLQTCDQECHYNKNSPPQSAASEVSRWENNVIVMEIGFEVMEVTKVTQSQSMTPITLLSNLGGSMGLWLGASLFTVIQLIIFVFMWCSSLCRKMKQKLKIPITFQ